jgi:hypothetical protein
MVSDGGCNSRELVQRDAPRKQCLRQGEFTDGIPKFQFRMQCDEAPRTADKPRDEA